MRKVPRRLLFLLSWHLPIWRKKSIELFLSKYFPSTILFLPKKSDFYHIFSLYKWPKFGLAFLLFIAFWHVSKVETCWFSIPTLIIKIARMTSIKSLIVCLPASKFQRVILITDKVCCCRVAMKTDFVYTQHYNQGRWQRKTSSPWKKAVYTHVLI